MNLHGTEGHTPAATVRPAPAEARHPPAPPAPASDDAAERYRQGRIAFWDAAARARRSRPTGAYYHRRLADVYRFLVPPGQRVLEVGCGRGDLLAALAPAHGVGVDFSAEALADARARHPALHFVEADVQDVGRHLEPMREPFDAIVLSDLVNDVWDVQALFERVRPLTTPRTRVIMNFFSHVWERPLALGSRLGLATRTLRQNWLTVPDLANLLYLTGFEVMRTWHEVLWPLGTRGVAGLFNRGLVRLPVLRWLALTNFLVARPSPADPATAAAAAARDARGGGAPPPTVSVIVPARNEAGNVRRIVERVPEMGGGTELIFVEGHSRDDTYGAIAREVAARPGGRLKLLRQTGSGKGDAVRLGFAEASGDVLMILDADLTVPPEDLPRFYEALFSGKGEFVNGVRLVYPMEQGAMRLLNLAGNKFFSFLFSWLLGQPVKDTLCGTKVMWADDYRRLAANRSYFGDFDPFGDFDLLFGSAKLNLKIVDLPIRYRERTYGQTNIQRWKHGLLLLRMSAVAARRLKFV